MDESFPSHIPFPGFEDDYDEDLDDISESELDDDVDDSRARFRAATIAMENRHDKFAEPQALYDFLYEFRDAIGLVMEDSYTFLHVAIRFVKDNRDARSGNMMPLIQSIVKEHPMLLRQRDSDGVTPLYMAICTRKPLLIEAILSGCAQYPEWESAVQDSIEIPCVRQKSKTCLHIAFELAIRERVVIELIKTARDEALALQDEDGRTALHYAVDSRRPSLAAARLFIQRDDEILKKRESEGTANLVETFLDVIDKVGNSVYRHHLVTKEKKRSISLKRDIKRQTVPSVRKTSNKSEKQPITDLGRKEIGQKRPSSPTLRLQKADIRTAGSMQLIEKQEKPDERSGKQATAQEWNKILKELKLHYMRTRNAVMAVSFLYGSNMNDIELHLDLHGLPSKIEATPFLEFLSSLKFDETLQFVSLPDIQVDFKRRSQFIPHNNTKKSGKERRDLKFFFDCLQTQGVRHIIRVDVEDSREFPHSDQAISESFHTITVEQFNWKKVDLDPRVICKLGSKATWGEVTPDLSTTCDSQIREVTLSWSGNNTILRAWSEPEGLPLLPRLRKITILVPADEEMAESPDWVSACLAEFRQRIARNALTKADSSVVVEEGENDNVSKSKGSSDIESGGRRIEIYLVQSRGKGQNPENLHTFGQPRPSVESRAGYRWLDTVYGFADILKQFWDRSVDEFRPDMRKHTGGDVVVALIDDGVDAYGSSVSANIIGGKSFAFDKRTNMLNPFYVSEIGHGTVMAEAIKRVCPMVKIYPIRVNIDSSESGQSSVEARSVALAVETAINRNANIILIPLSIEVTKSSPQDKTLLEYMLQKAYDQNILLFVPSNRNEELQSSFNFRPNAAFRIGEARDDGGAPGRSYSPSDADFIFPGRDVITQHDIESPRRSSDRILDLNSASINVNVSLAAGLAAILIYAFKFVLLKKTAETLSVGLEIVDQDDLSQLERLQRYHGMMKAFQHLGSVTESGFLKVWEALDPIVDEMKDFTVEDQELGRLNQWFSQIKYTEDR
ncbi:hypothetical protein NW761_011584 [Fusarium oxysporum]|nr:hypothetical protein NW758_014655 [Fusarium oxysporum]KAJ4078838.1 hypothetical protein NW761_011584 [Fusarium oxysporum]WKT49603.1 Ankyrin repeat [Fusarium oxysporum f. sp. vasinfectum]